MNRKLLPGVTAVLLGLAQISWADTGPTQSPLRITGMFTKNGNGTIYVQFQPGSMPGCYATSGGYLFPSNTFYKEIYAQLLSINAGVSIKASVLFTVNASANQWSDCTIDGLYIQGS
jgi:hypothetical protein